jgi:TRAP-type C4-dicarboxylate transport system substrate-binding protein
MVDGYTPGRFVLSEVAELPFLGDNAEVNSVAYQRTYDKHLAKANEHAGVKILAVFTHGPGLVFNNKRPIDTLKDLEGMKIRTGGGMVNDVVKSLGAVAMLKPAPETYELLSAGVVDGYAFPMEAPFAFKLTPLTKYATVIPGGLYNVSFSFLMNPAKWNSIPEADRKLIEPLLGEALARRAGKAWDAADAKGVADLRNGNVAVSVASPALISEIKARTETLEQAWVNKAAAKGVDGTAALRTLRGEIAKLKAEMTAAAPAKK